VQHKLCILVAVMVVIGLTCVSGCTEEKEIEKQISDVQAPLENQGNPTNTPTALKSTAAIDVTAQYLGTYVSDNQFLQPKAGNKYVQFYVTVTNVNDNSKPDLGNQFNFKLFDSSNEGHTPVTVSFGGEGIQSYPNSHPSDKTSGKVIFEITASAAPKQLIYDDWSNKITINM
jgi:hypothetical protein